MIEGHEEMFGRRMGAKSSTRSLGGYRWDVRLKVHASWGTLGASPGVGLGLELYPAGPIFRAMAPWTPRTKRRTLLSWSSAGRRVGSSNCTSHCTSVRALFGRLWESAIRTAGLQQICGLAVKGVQYLTDSMGWSLLLRSQPSSRFQLCCLALDTSGHHICGHAGESFSNQFLSSTWPPSQVLLSCSILDESD